MSPSSPLESSVLCDRIRGTCYRGANWISIGKAQGRGRGERMFSINTLFPSTKYPLPLSEKISVPSFASPHPTVDRFQGFNEHLILCYKRMEYCSKSLTVKQKRVAPCMGIASVSSQRNKKWKQSLILWLFYPLELRFPEEDRAIFSRQPVPKGLADVLPSCPP